VVSRLPRLHCLLIPVFALSAGWGVPVLTQEPGYFARVGVRLRPFPGIYDGLTRPPIPGRDLPAGVGLRSRGLYAPGSLPGLSTSVEVQPGGNQIRFLALYGRRPVGRPQVLTLEDYLERVRSDQARRQLVGATIAGLQQKTAPGERSLLAWEIPITIPKGLSSVVGEGGAGLRISGNRSIRFSGRSEWTEGAVSTATAYQSKFPALNMEQTSQFRIEGTVGSKLEVTVDQDSRALTDLENRINIRYLGFEDEILQEVIAGNTDFRMTGSQFLGFNQGAQGLFGLKAVARLGDLTVTALASQEKGAGEKATFRAGAKETKIRRPDIEPLLGTYYFLDQAYRSRFEERSVAREDSIVAIGVYIDDSRYENDAEMAAIPDAVAYFDPDNPTPEDSRETHKGSFHELNSDQYYISRALGVLALNFSLGPTDVLGVVYTTAGGRTVGHLPAPSDSTLVMKLIKPKDPRPADATWRYELRNVYYLGARNIPAEGFNVKIFLDRPSGEDDYTQNGADFLQLLGLDQWGELPGTPPDGKIDLNENYVNLARGELIFPDLEPWLNPALTEQVAMYDEIDRQTLVRTSRYYLEISLSTRQSSFTLPAQNLLEGSDVVTLNGRRLVRGSDYQINYLTGELTFLTEAIQDPTADVQVDYEYSPLIQLEQKVLLGARAEYDLGPTGRISGTVLSRSERTLDPRVRLGREPNRAMVLDATAVLNFQPSWMTRAVDLLPLISTRAPSRLDIEAEAAYSLPNPNTRGEALVDDFEGARNGTGYGIGRGRWTPSATPAGRSLDERMRMIWYNPYDLVSSRDIWPNKETDIRSDRVNVLSLFLAPGRPSPWPAGRFDWSSVEPARRWNGVQQSVAAGAADLTRMQYLELWVKGDRGELHLDIGTISEDADGNGVLNTEDQLINGVRNGIVDAGEDVGLDGLNDEQELDFYLLKAGDNPLDYPTLEAKKQRFTERYGPKEVSFRDPDDPASDNWDYSNPSNYSLVNGTERSKNDPDRLGRPDTEDINRNGYLDLGNNYVSYVLDLSPDSPDSIYVQGGDTDPATWGGETSWRLYRIPLADVRTTAGSPDLSRVESIRLWLTAAPDASSFTVSIATLDVVGNVWREEPVIDGGITLPPETVRVSVRNTFENAEVYTPPPDVLPVRDRVSNLIQQEQSLAVVFHQLPPGVEGEVLKSIARAEDFTQYQGLAMYLNGQPAESWMAGPDTSYIEAFLRFGADAHNFYEYRTRVYPGWDDRNEMRVDFAEITRLKTDLLDCWGTMPGVPDTTLGNYRVVGRPSLTNIRRITVGVRNIHSSLPLDGEFWADEMRVIEVRRDTGSAVRASIHGELADLASFDLRLDRRTADFQTLRERRGTLSTTSSASLSMRAALDRFTPTAWGLAIPLTVNWRRNLNLPKYLPGSDLVLAADEQYDQRTSMDDESISIGIRKTAASSNPLVAWTLDRMNVNVTASRRDGRSPVNPINESFQIQGQFGWDFTPRWRTTWHPFEWLFFLPKSLRETPFNPVPTQLDYGFNASQSGERVADRNLVERRRYALTGNERFRLSLRPFEHVRSNYQLTLDRDLTDDWKLGDANLGREIGRRQQFDTTWEPNTFRWLNQRYQYRADYRENNDPRFNTRVLQGAGGPQTVQLGRDVTAGTDTQANYSMVLSQLMGTPGSREGLSGLPRLINDLKALALRMQPVILNISQQRNANQYNLAGRPGLAYRFGLRESPDVERSATVTTQQSLIRTVTRVDFSTGVRLPLDVDLETRPRWNWTDNLSDSRTTFTYSVTWPSANVRWSGLGSLWFFPAISRGIMLNSGFDQIQEKTDWLSDLAGGGRTPFSRRRIRAWRPLLSLQMSLNNGMSVTLSRNHSASVQEQIGGAGSLVNTLVADLRLGLNYAFSAPEGIRIPFFRRPLRVPSNLQLAFDVSRSESKTTVAIRDPRSSLDRPEYKEPTPTQSTATWSFKPDVRYNFSRRVQGGLNILFENTNDRLMRRTRKIREVAFYVNLNFS
jgi:hypothetical protein